MAVSIETKERVEALTKAIKLSDALHEALTDTLWNEVEKQVEGLSDSEIFDLVGG